MTYLTVDLPTEAIGGETVTGRVTVTNPNYPVAMHGLKLRIEIDILDRVAETATFDVVASAVTPLADQMPEVTEQKTVTYKFTLYQDSVILETKTHELTLYPKETAPVTQTFRIPIFKGVSGFVEESFNLSFDEIKSATLHIKITRQMAVAMARPTDISLNGVYLETITMPLTVPLDWKFEKDYDVKDYLQAGENVFRVDAEHSYLDALEYDVYIEGEGINVKATKISPETGQVIDITQYFIPILEQIPKLATYMPLILIFMFIAPSWLRIILALVMMAIILPQLTGLRIGG